MSEPACYSFASDGAIPNSALPLLVYRAALPRDPAAIEALLGRHRWPAAWRDGVHPWHHFHANTHEALGVARGWAKVLFGGPNGTALEVVAGDLVVVPAGVGHCALAKSDDLLIVGAYPDNAPRPDMHCGRAEDHDRLRLEVARVKPPAADPATGAAAIVAWG
jgi:uncharacterized protein YjlB